ncbi:hypothetical protein F4861DRAFT_510200 [Xylaria intraflava]|nr:hypothetical protein F4861DRAFT_510200 [Xylaria intraflava]
MSPSRLVDLPAELIGEICTLLVRDSLFQEMRIFDDSTINRRALARLNISCKALHSMTTPFLTKLRKSAVFPRIFYLSFIRYACDILQDRRLAARESTFEATHYNPLGPVEIGDAATLDSAARRLRGQPPSRWIHCGDFDCGEADYNMIGAGYQIYDAEAEQRHIGYKSELLALILVNLPNLSRLFLPDDFDLSHLPPQSLPSLREVSLRAYSDYMVVSGSTVRLCDLGRFANLFHAAPRLERLKVRSCSGCSEPLQLRNLRAVVMEDSSLSAESARNLLRGCVRLERFSYNASPAGSTNAGALDPEARPSDFVHALLRARFTLQELRVVTARNPGNDSAVDDDGAENGSRIGAALGSIVTSLMRPVHLKSRFRNNPRELKTFTALRAVSFEERGSKHSIR